MDAANDAALGLGLDAGGTTTRWAVARGDGRLLAEGQLPGFSGLTLQDPERRPALVATINSLAAALRSHGAVQGVQAGITGLGQGNEPGARWLREQMARALDLPPIQVQLVSDIELACRDAFEPGEGYLVYAGTGSVAAFLDARGVLHRIGGRGGVLDDAGSGFWIAREALKRIWRAEDEQPGAWRHSPLARRVFERIGSSEWAACREFVYRGDRGAVGQLALAVAAAAEEDHAAMQLLQEAGRELGGLACTLWKRFGPRPVAIAGRVRLLHPIIEQAVQAALPAAAALRVAPGAAHCSAARRAARASHVASLPA